MADGETVGTRFAVPVEFEAGDIVSQLNIDQVTDLVCEIDQAAGSWELTQRLAAYFNEEMRHAPKDAVPKKEGGE